MNESFVRSLILIEIINWEIESINEVQKTVNWVEILLKIHKKIYCYRIQKEIRVIIFWKYLLDLIIQESSFSPIAIESTFRM